MEETFIAERITGLRLAGNISEYQTSLGLGQSKGCARGIAYGKCLPPVKQLFHIADDFPLTVSAFFDVGKQDSPLVLEAGQILRKLEDDDVKLVLALLRRISRKVERQAGRLSA